MTGINLTEAQAKAALKSFGNSDTYTNLQQVGTNCGKCGGYFNGRGGISKSKGSWTCPSCMSKSHNRTEKMVTALVDKSDNQSRINAAKEVKAMSDMESVAQPYIDAGLGAPFAHAIARDPAVEGSVMDLWEASWWKQYEVDDILIVSVLNGVLIEDDAKWLNTVRSDHEDLVRACIDGTCTTDWARALLGSGFLGDSDGVTSCLAGGVPSIVARIRRKKIKVDSKIVPPPLSAPKKLKKKTKKKPVQVINYGGMSQSKLSQFCRDLGLQTSGSKNVIRNRLENCKNVLGNHSPLPKGNRILTQLKRIASEVKLKSYGTMKAETLRRKLLTAGRKLGVDMQE